METKKILLSNKDMRWFKEILGIVYKGYTQLNNIKVEYRGLGNWNHVSFDYKDIDLRKENK